MPSSERALPLLGLRRLVSSLPRPHRCVKRRPDVRIAWIPGLAAIAVALVAVVSGARLSPLVPVLPAGAQPLLPFRWTARILGISGLSAEAKGVVVVASFALSGGAFLWALWAAWRGEISLRTALMFGLAFHVIAVAMPLVVSRDVYQYAIFGRILSIHHANPYVSTPRSFATDPLYPLVSPQWKDTPLVYGPLFARLSGVIATLASSPAALVAAFKVLSGVASAMAMLIVAWLARRRWPEKAAFAVVLIGWNPAVLFDGVGAGHFDTLVGLTLALAIGFIAFPRTRRLGTELLATAALTLGAMLKFPVAAPLALLVIAAVIRRPSSRRLGALACHLGVIAGLVAPLVVPFVQRHDPTLGAWPLFRYENFLAPTGFVSSAIKALATGGSDLPLGVTTGVRGAFSLAFLAGFLLLVAMIIRRVEGPGTEGAAWSAALLLFALCAPLLWPWYLVWVLPLAWLLPRPGLAAMALLSAALPILVTVAEPVRARLVYHVLLEMGRSVVAPALLVLLVVFLRHLIFAARQKEDPVVRASVGVAASSGVPRA